MEVVSVDERCTLLLAGEDEVQMCREAEPCVEWDIGEDKVEMRLDKEEDGQDSPVHEPWGQLGGVGGPEGFVGGEDWEEDGEGCSG